MLQRKCFCWQFDDWDAHHINNGVLLEAVYSLSVEDSRLIFKPYSNPDAPVVELVTAYAELTLDVQRDFLTEVLTELYFSS